MRLLRKSVGYTTITAGLAGVTVCLVYGPEELKRKITSNGLVRVARSARTVSAYTSHMADCIDLTGLSICFRSVYRCCYSG